MAGMTGIGGDIRSKGLTMMQRYSSLNEKMKAEQEAMDRAEEAQQSAMNMQYGSMGGMAAGALIGGQMTSWSGPGMLVGAGIGALVGALGGSLF
jgi:uncharacterized membrane protein